MNNETRAKIVKAAPNRWLVFCILTLSGGIAFKLSSMKDMFYVPMQQFMGLTNTQIGGALSATASCRPSASLQVFTSAICSVRNI